MKPQVCRAMVQETLQGAPATYAKEMERLSAKESLLLAFKDSGGFEALVTGKTTEMQRIDVNERITGLERLNPTPRPTTSPFLEGRWNFEWFGTGSPGLFAARFIFERFPPTLANLTKMDLTIKDGYAKIIANMKVLNSIESKFILSTKLSVEGPLRMKEEYVEGVLETPSVNEATIPEQLKGGLLPGDGIGPEVISVAKDVLKLAGSLEGIEFGFQEMPVGGSALDLTGVPLPEETLSVAKLSDAVLLGAIGGYKWDNNQKHLKPETGLLQLREGLKVFANLRPATVLPQLVDASTLKKEIAEGVDLMVVRELTGGIYFGKPRGFGTNENGEEIGYNTEVYATYEIDRIARVAFETARKRCRKLCSVDKANVLEASMLWRKRVTAIASEYPDVELSHMYVDNAAMQLVRDPKQFDTIVTNNIFGDILSDEASMITGSIGMLPSASIGESGPGLFEPIHGSAPDIAGQDKANPLATVLSAAMLLRYGLGEENAAKRIENAVVDALNRGFRTGDIYSAGNKLVGCKEMGHEVLKSVDLRTPAAV